MSEGSSEIRLNPALRDRAERFLAATGSALEEFTPMEAQKLVYELYTHQMELFLQNEELRREQLVVQRFLHRREEARVLLEVARAIAEHRPFVQTAGAIFDVCRLLTGATSGYAVLSGNNGREHEVLHLKATGKPSQMPSGLSRHISGLQDESRGAGQILYDNDFPRNARRQRFCPPWRVTPDNVLFAPLTREGKAAGCLLLANKPGGFTENDVQLAAACVEMAAIARDNRRLLQALTQSEERLRSLIETAIDAIIATDGRGRILSFNQGARDIFGYQEEEALGQPLAVLFPERYRTACQRQMDRRRFSGKVPFPGKTLELHGLRRDGGEFPLELSLSRWEAGGKSGYAAVIRGGKQAEDARREEELCISLFREEGVSFAPVPSLISSLADDRPASPEDPGPPGEPAAMGSGEIPVKSGKPAAKNPGGLKGGK